MKSFRIFNRQTGAIVALVAMVLAVVAPTIASAAQLTERSVELSSSSAKAENVSYTVNFKSVGAAGAVVIDFCQNSPLIGATCTAPTGFDASSAASTFGSVNALDANTIVVTGTIAAATAISVPLTAITNPDAAGPIYARIITYDTNTHANSYLSAQTADDDANRVDEGAAAISITDSIGVSAAVLESMTFCVSGATIAKDCVGAGGTAPTLKLGETSGGVTALSAGSISTGDIYTQISTNAVSGAVVRLKSNALSCGGLVRAGGVAGNCDIKPVLYADTATFDRGQAKFGVKTTDATDSSGATATGTYEPVTASHYNTSTYLMNYVAGDGTGVTSPYGDEFLDTAGAPVNNKNIKLTFGASIANDTPAGLYSVDLGLIATGKF